MTPLRIPNARAAELLRIQAANYPVAPLDALSATEKGILEAMRGDPALRLHRDRFGLWYLWAENAEFGGDILEVRHKEFASMRDAGLIAETDDGEYDGHRFFGLATP